VLVSNNPFHPSLLFPGTTQESDPKGALIGLTPTSLTTIILGCKGSPGTNALAYLLEATVTKEKIFITLITARDCREMNDLRLRVSVKE
jgi:hypothetical protein